MTIPVIEVCHCCGGPLGDFYHIAWCDSCLNEYTYGDKQESMSDFIARKRRERYDATGTTGNISKAE